jgi:hypothetical protein
MWSVRTDGTEVVRGVSAVNLAFLEFGVDSSNQNLAEYIGAILAVLGQVILHRHSPEERQCDSPDMGRPRGVRVTNASIVWTLLCIAADVVVYSRQGSDAYRWRGQRAMRSPVPPVGHREGPDDDCVGRSGGYRKERGRSGGDGSGSGCEGDNRIMCP